MPINTHPFSSEDVMAYLDGELLADAAAEMTAHLAQCRVCQDVAADLQGVSRQLSGWAIEPFGDGMPANVAACLDEKAAEQAAKKKGLRWHSYFPRLNPWPVAGACALVVVGALLLQRRDLPHSAAPQTMHASEEVTNALSSMQESLKLERFADLQRAPEPKAQAAAPLVVRTAEISVTARNFETVRTDLDHLLLQFGGHIAQLNLASPAGEARSLHATLRVPAGQLDEALGGLRKLGHVNSESVGGEEVTQQSVDLEARLTNLRNTEQRLTQILATRTGKLSDVLDVEQKISEVRGQIEQAEAEQKNLNNRISFATVQLTVAEDYRAPLANTTRISNAAVRGLDNAFNGLLGLLLVALRAGPSLLLFGALLALPGYFLWKHLRHR